MYDLFSTILGMSITASYVIVSLIIIRLLLKKSPKIISYMLWSVVAFRLVVPFSFESVLSLVPKSFNETPISNNVVVQQVSNNGSLNNVDIVNGTLPVIQEIQVSSVSFETMVVAIWVIGVVILVGYYIYSVYKLKSQLKNSKHVFDNIYEADNLKTPFVLGVFEPKIYLPNTLNEEERKYIILHEKVHIKRKDYIVKSFSFVLLAVYWFNPLVWVAYILMNKDMEFSCDERVLKELSGDIRKSYATSLVSLATEKHIVNRIAFGEGDVKGRVKNVLGYKRRSVWIIGITVIIAIILGFGLISNPVSSSEDVINEAVSNGNIDSSDKATNVAENNVTENNVTEEVMNNYILVGESNPTHGLFYLGMSSEEALDKIYEVDLETDLYINLGPKGTYVDEVLRVMEELENYDEVMYELTVSDLIHLYFDKDKLLKEVLIQQPGNVATYDDVLNYYEENKGESFYLGTMLTENFVNLLSTKDDLLEYYGEPDQYIQKSSGDLYIYEINQDLDLMFTVVGGEDGTTPFVYRISYGESYPVK